MKNIISDKIFIIAEAGVNHNGSLDFAKKMVDAAKASAADAVKFQTFRTEDFVCKNAPKADYQIRAASDDGSQYLMLKSLELSENAQTDLLDYCKKQNILFLSSPFDLRSADFLIHDLNLSLLKLGSGEITNLPLLLKIAKANVSLILSTGMSTLGDIENALAALSFGYLFSNNQRIPSLEDCFAVYQSDDGQKILREKVALLHCTTAYPTSLKNVNLKAMNTLKQAFNLAVGYSDHTLGLTVPIASAALGAQIIEKHFTLDKTMEGPDHQASLTPEELTQMVLAVRDVEKSLGHGQKIPTEQELKNRQAARKSIVALHKIHCGDLFSEENIGCKRPGTGISPMQLGQFNGRHAEQDYKPDELIGI
ncbi:MAG: N-acetylneuraminate synthase [uncultured bacterium]|nr:MAG: N-acetylneuraminate synthase [uncultured bacterium]